MRRNNRSGTIPVLYGNYDISFRRNADTQVTDIKRSQWISAYDY